jgi:geranylgeranyl diphosphate synthase type I
MGSKAVHFLESQRPIIAERLVEIFESKTAAVRMHRWGEDLLERFQSFTLQGKMIRGGLIVLSHLLFREDVPEPLFNLAAAVEIVHSSLLIHDDIMDRDTLRRGSPSIYHQYRTLALEEGFEDPDHFGESLGICAGDVGFFLASEILASLELDPRIVRTLMSRWASEFISVGLAQMQDVSQSGTGTDGGISEDDIVHLYGYKTARYTFSLPLALGALAAEAGSESVAQLERIGEYMGIAFQLKDDELDLFGDETVTGKPVGTDMQEGKKTLYWLHLKRLLDAGGELAIEDRGKLSDALRKGDMKNETLLWVRDLVRERGIRNRVESSMRELNARAVELIEKLDVRREYREILLSVARYTVRRNR